MLNFLRKISTSTLVCANYTHEQLTVELKRRIVKMTVVHEASYLRCPAFNRWHETARSTGLTPTEPTHLEDGACSGAKKYFT